MRLLISPRAAPHGERRAGVGRGRDAAARRAPLPEVIEQRPSAGSTDTAGYYFRARGALVPVTSRIAPP